jgi:hypothetical protein
MLRTIFFMLKRGEYYRDSATNYEQLSVQRNASRWIKALTRFGFIPQPLDSRQLIVMTGAGQAFVRLPGASFTLTRWPRCARVLPSPIEKKRGQAACESAPGSRRWNSSRDFGFMPSFYFDVFIKMNALKPFPVPLLPEPGFLACQYIALSAIS